MSNRPIHENLDTSFVNLSALIKYLRKRQFIGKVDVQLNGYEASVRLKRDNKLEVNEHDQISGRVSVGEEALQRVLIRSREPGGTINVYQLTNEAENKSTTTQVSNAAKSIPTKRRVSKPISPPANGNGKLPTSINGNPINKTNGSVPITKSKPEVVKVDEVFAEEKLPERAPTLPNFPFELSNEVEAKAKQVKFSEEDWQKLLKVTVELLAVVDRSLAMAQLDFTAAFVKARTEIAADYPFLSPASESFDYAGGRIKMTERINAKIFVAGIVEAVKRILDKLALSPKFAEVHHQTIQRLQIMMKKRASIYNQLSISQQLKRLVNP